MSILGHLLGGLWPSDPLPPKPTEQTSMAAGMLGVHTATSTEALLAALLAALDDSADEDGMHLRPDPGCLECTSGATPDSRNTGPCAYHAARRVVG